MRSRTVQPIRRRGQGGNVNRNSGRRDLGDTQPMRPVNPSAYQRRIDARREVVRTPGPAQARASARRRPQRTGLAAVVYRLRKKNAEKEQYFDYDFLLAVVFMMFLGHFML